MKAAAPPAGRGTQRPARPATAPCCSAPLCCSALPAPLRCPL